jgi:hypothetical protein
LLPVEAFRDVPVYAAAHPPEKTFQSSGTSGMSRSRHAVANLKLYRESAFRGFDLFFPDNPVILAYTPGYSANPDSSLVWMLEQLIARDASGLSRFLPIHAPISEAQLETIEMSGRPLVLFGAAFGLLEMAERMPVALPEKSVIIETGGMKTYRREISRAEMHRILANGFSVPEGSIQSEYGMCELLSQAYTRDGNHFETPPWMRLSVRHPEQLEREQERGLPGRLAVIDLANLYSCPFILTGDRAVVHEKGVEIQGRWNAYDLRGCNFLMEDL